MASSPEEKQQAAQVRVEGNVFFKKGKFSAAADRYTEAIALAPDVVVLYLNRALCHKRLEQWVRCEDDSRTALALTSAGKAGIEYMKANYYLGSALRFQLKYAESALVLERAVDAARDLGEAMKDDIWRELAACKYARWEQEATVRADKRDRLAARLAAMMDCYFKKHPQDKGRDRDERDLAEVFGLAARIDRREEAHNAYTCTLTMEPFREPVSTAEGNSYERAALLEHLQKVGPFDPVSRKPLSAQDLFPNRCLRHATQVYLDEHPHLWGECINPVYL